MTNGLTWQRTETVEFTGARGGEARLTWGQQALWRLTRWLDDGDPYFNLPWSLPVYGRRDLGAVLRALRGLVERHEALRTTYEEVPGGPVQRVAREGRFTVEVFEAGEARPLAAARELSAELAAKGFDYATEPPLRCAVVTGDGRPRAVAFALSHLAVDGWSLNVLATEWRGLLAGEELPAPVWQPLDQAAFEGEGRAPSGGAGAPPLARGAGKGAQVPVRLPRQDAGGAAVRPDRHGVRRDRGRGGGSGGTLGGQHGQRADHRERRAAGRADGTPGAGDAAHRGQPARLPERGHGGHRRAGRALRPRSARGDVRRRRPRRAPAGAVHLPVRAVRPVPDDGAPRGGRSPARRRHRPVGLLQRRPDPRSLAGPARRGARGRSRRDSGPHRTDQDLLRRRVAEGGRDGLLRHRSRHERLPALPAGRHRPPVTVHGLHAAARSGDASGRLRGRGGAARRDRRTVRHHPDRAARRLGDDGPRLVRPAGDRSGEDRPGGHRRIARSRPRRGGGR
ncbi:condensation domain-containing protein [Streptosporangium lutulentum]